MRRMRASRRPAVVSTLTVLRAFLISTLLVASGHAENGRPLIENGGYVVTYGGSDVVQYHRDTPFIPASTIKIATAFTALEVLGPSYRFKTEFYLRDQETLVIKGYGDPYLLSEYLTGIADTLRKKGLKRVSGLVLDDSFFAVESGPDGSANSANPYDAVNSALSVNFNSLPLIKYDNGTAASPEPQTPFLPIGRDIAPYLEPGVHRVNVASFTGSNESITHRRYVAELFAEQLRRQGIEVASRYQVGRISVSDTLLHTYVSRKSLEEMIRGCLRYSNNFIANQLLLTSAAACFGPPATWEKAAETARLVLTDRAALQPSEFIIVEGSGLSPKNRITPAAMIKLLEAFKPYAYLLSRKNGIALKSGTLTGVYNYAGYFESSDRLDPFVMLLNQQRNNRDALLSRLTERYRQAANQQPAAQ